MRRQGRASRLFLSRVDTWTACCTQYILLHDGHNLLREYAMRLQHAFPELLTTTSLRIFTSPTTRYGRKGLRHWISCTYSGPHRHSIYKCHEFHVERRGEIINSRYIFILGSSECRIRLNPKREELCCPTAFTSCFITGDIRCLSHAWPFTLSTGPDHVEI